MMTKILFFLILICSASQGMAQSYLMDGSPINDCGGFFLDSGGATGNYASDESFTTVICPDLSTGTHVQLIFSGVDLAAGDNLCFFDGTDASAPPLSCASDFNVGAPFIIQATAVNPGGCLTIVFESDASGEGAGWSADINCIAACQTILSVISNANPAVFPADTGWIDICPGDAVSFQGQGIYPQNGAVYQHSDLTSSFFWDFGDGTTAEGVDVTKIYDEPGGYIVQLTIVDQFGCSNTNFISQRVRVSTFPIFELGQVPDEICVGDTLELAASVSEIDSLFEVSVEPTQGSFQTTGVRSDSLPLPDGDGASYSTSILFNSFSPGQTLTSIDDLLGICVSMEHSWLFDLEINLTCPDGTTVILQDQQQILNEVYLGNPYQLDDDLGNPIPIPGTGLEYCWTPNATNGTWTEYVDQFDPQTLPSQDYNSFEALDAFLGCPLNGEWTITVVDKWASDNGWIFEWSIGFADDLYPDIEVFEPQIVDFRWLDNPAIVYNGQDSIIAVPQNAGLNSFIFEVTDNFGCSAQAPIPVNVLPAAHPNCFNCNATPDLLQDTSICTGEQVMVDASLPSGNTPESLTYETFSGETINHITAPSGLPLESAIIINSYNPLVLSDAVNQISSVCVNLEHSFTGDIDLWLMAPDGQLMELTSDNGGSGDDYANTCFSPTATDNITTGTPPFTGNFQPEGNWEDLNGTSTNGEWTLVVADDQPGFSGQLIGWSISFAFENEITYSWEPNPDLSCNDCPNPTITPMSTTSYFLEISDDFNCIQRDTIEVEVLMGFDAPQLSCQPSGIDGLDFSWLPINGASTYEVSLDGGNTWIPANGTLQHTLTGLASNQMVTIEVRVVSVGVGNCPAAIGTATCNAPTCVFDLSTVALVPPSCSGNLDGQVTLTAMGSFGNVDYFLNGNGPFGPIFNNLGEGPQVFSAIDANGCIDTLAIELSPSGVPLDLMSTIDSVSCAGNSDGQVEVMPTNGSGNFAYLWNTNPVSTGPLATGLA
ncbi:MAG: proprotein convertase P-domain-containing protein, partial [Bacteroidota bacterium]